MILDIFATLSMLFWLEKPYIKYKKGSQYFISIAIFCWYCWL